MEDRKALERLLRENQREQTWLEDQLQKISLALGKFEKELQRLKPNLSDAKNYSAALKLTKQISHAADRVDEMGTHLKNTHFSEVILRKKLAKIPKG